ncbi:MAG: sigma-54 dependent transcriptional regulator, partial [Verrucomicrobiota bacterium]
RGEDPAFRATLEAAATMAEHRVPVLLSGETGTGKGLVARLIHGVSGRDPERFFSVNCGALPERLIESILFGHRKGAFTGASENMPGKFVQADGGTLFLDEVGEMPVELQPRLLKVLEDGVVEPLGSTKGVAVDVRVVAATNRDLKAEVMEGNFREDLYYRLSFGIIQLPPLRERRSDIHHIASYFLSKFNRSLKDPKRLSGCAVKRLEQHHWKGNIRDLENVIGRSVLLSKKELLEADDMMIDEVESFGSERFELPVPHEDFSLEEFLMDARKKLILQALEMSGGKQAGASRLLGITPQAVHKFLKSIEN